MQPRHDHRIRTLPGHRDIHTHMFDNVCLGIQIHAQERGQQQRE
ncbi:MAG: hypothetical protein ACPIOQ_12800 [Promethearchaeia archaeon]